MLRYINDAIEYWNRPLCRHSNVINATQRKKRIGFIEIKLSWGIGWSCI